MYKTRINAVFSSLITLSLFSMEYTYIEVLSPYYTIPPESAEPTYLYLQQTEPFTKQTFQELIKTANRNNKPFKLARVSTSSVDKSSFYWCCANELNKYLISNQKDLEHIYDIHYFLIEKNMSITYCGSYRKVKNNPADLSKLGYYSFSY